MKTYLHILALTTCVAFITSSPASEIRESDEGSGDGPEIVINDVVEKIVETNDGDNAVESAANPLLDMEMNPEDNEIKVNEKIVDDVTNKLDKKKCQKCTRYHYHARHADFCGTCEKKNENEEVKNEETTQASKTSTRCKKCARKNFKARNEAFCSEQCSTEEESKPIENKHQNKVHNKKVHNKKKHVSNEKTKEEETRVEITESESAPEVADVKVSDLVGEVDEIITEQDIESNENKNIKKNKKQKQKNKDKNKKKNKKHNDVKQVEIGEKLEEPIVTIEETEAQKDTVKLGPLENLIRFLIKSNTYTH